MKKLIINLFILMVMIASGQAQDQLKIGEYKNGKLVVTNPQGLKDFFLNSLDNSGTLGKDYKTSISPQGDRCMIYYPVSGNKERVNSIGVMLVKSKNDFLIVDNPHEIETVNPGGTGGSVTIQCVGVDCNSCLPKIEWIDGWIPRVYCDCTEPGGGQCDMISTTTIQLIL